MVAARLGSMSDENEKPCTANFVKDCVCDHDPSWRGSCPRSIARSKLDAVKECQEHALERLDQGNEYGAFLDYTQAFQRARQAYYVTHGREWGPAVMPDTDEVFKVCEYAYCGLLYYAKILEKEANERRVERMWRNDPEGLLARIFDSDVGTVREWLRADRAAKEEE